jgi:hypothetical protein
VDHQDSLAVAVQLHGDALDEPGRHRGAATVRRPTR